MILTVISDTMTPHLCHVFSKHERISPVIIIQDPCNYFNGDEYAAKGLASIVSRQKRPENIDPILYSW